MTFSRYYSPEALPALVVRQRASVSTGFSGIFPSGLLEVPRRFALGVVSVNGGIRDLEPAVLLYNLFLELTHGHPTGSQPIAALR